MLHEKTDCSEHFSIINTAANVCFVFALPEFPSFPFPQLQENIYFDSEQYS